MTLGALWLERGGRSGQPLVAKAVLDVAIEVGALRLGGDQSLEDGVWDGEVAVDRAATKLQVKGRVHRVPHGREQRRHDSGPSIGRAIHRIISAAGTPRSKAARSRSSAWLASATKRRRDSARMPMERALRRRRVPCRGVE